MVAQRLAPPLALASAAVYLIVLPFGHVTSLRSASLVLALAAATTLWLARPPRAVPLLPLFVVWFAAALISLAETRNLQSSLEAINGEVLRSFLVFFVFYVVVSRLQAYRFCVATSAVGLGLLSVLAIASFYRHGAWVFHYVPPLGDFATCAVTVTPLLVGYIAFFRHERALIALCSVATGVMLIAGYLTFSRGFWLALVSVVVVGTALYAKCAARLSRRAMAGVVVVCVLFLVLAGLGAAARDRTITFMGDRWVIYSAVLKKIPENPLTGTGYGHETDKPWYERARPGAEVYHAHNIALSYLDQMGPAGLLALAAIFALPAIAFASALRSCGAAAAMPAICGLALLAAIFVKNNVDHFFVKQNLWLFFAHLGIYLGQIEGASRSQALATASTGMSATSRVSGQTIS